MDHFPGDAAEKGKPVGAAGATGATGLPLATGSGHVFWGPIFRNLDDPGGWQPCNKSHMVSVVQRFLWLP